MRHRKGPQSLTSGKFRPVPTPVAPEPRPFGRQGYAWVRLFSASAQVSGGDIPRALPQYERIAVEDVLLLLVLTLE